MDTSPKNNTSNRKIKSELEKFKLFYEFPTTEKTVRAQFKDQPTRNR